MPKVRIWGEGPGLTVGPAESRDPGDLPRFVRRRRNPATAESMRQEQQSVFIELPDHLTNLEILSPPAAARELGCTPGRVIQLIEEKRLKAERLGRTWLILRQALEQYIAIKGTEIQRRYALFLDRDHADRTEAKQAKRASRKEGTYRQK